MVAQADEHEPEAAGSLLLATRGAGSAGPSTATFLYWASCAGVLLWGLVVNFIRLGPTIIMPDEGTYANAAWRYVQGTISPAIKLSPGSNNGPLPIGQSSAQINPDNFQHPPLAKWLFGLGQLVVGHQSVTADRTVAAIATFLTGIILLIWVARVAGRWVGLLACAFVLLLPEAVQGSNGLRLGRFGLLDPVAELFVVICCSCGSGSELAGGGRGCSRRRAAWQSAARPGPRRMAFWLHSCRSWPGSSPPGGSRGFSGGGSPRLPSRSWLPSSCSSCHTCRLTPRSCGCVT